MPLAEALFLFASSREVRALPQSRRLVQWQKKVGWETTFLQASCCHWARRLSCGLASFSRETLGKKSQNWICRRMHAYVNPLTARCSRNARGRARSSGANAAPWLGKITVDQPSGGLRRLLNQLLAVCAGLFLTSPWRFASAPLPAACSWRLSDCLP